MSTKNTTPVQKPPKLPATRPLRMLSEAPPCSEALTTSFTCFDVGEVKSLVNSGMRAAPRVPQLMMMLRASHQLLPRPPRMSQLARKVPQMLRMEVIHTSEVRGCSKLMSSALL